MFRSIRWRLTASYVLLTLLTVSVLGALAFSFARQSVKKQEIEFLTDNARTIAEQSTQFLWPVLRKSELSEFTHATSVLTNVRVRIYDSQHELLVDTGPTTGFDQFIWIQPPSIHNLDSSAQSSSAFIMPLFLDEETNHQSTRHLISLLTENYPKETRFSIIQRIPQAWGYHMTFEDSLGDSTQPDSPRSSRTYSLPIGDPDHPLGYVELLDGPDYGTDTLNTLIKGFFLASGGSLLLAALVGLVISGRLTSPLVKLTEVAGRMSNGDLSVRAPAFGKDEIGQLARRFNQMAGQLEQSFKSLASERDTLRRFISDASHELRTPITALKNFNELLMDKAAGDQQAQQEFLSQSQDQIRRMEWITQNLLNLSRLEAGLTPLKSENKDVIGLLDRIVTIFKMQAEKDDIRLWVEHPQTSFKIKADVALLEIALSNLVENALKFTDPGGEIILTVEEKEGNVRIFVQDTGIGIDQDDLPHVFEPFYRGKSVSVEGSGLGLALVESVIKAHGGKVYVESERGLGSTFTIELPILSEENSQDPSDSVNHELP